MITFYNKGLIPVKPERGSSSVDSRDKIGMDALSKQHRIYPRNVCNFKRFNYSGRITGQILSCEKILRQR